MTELTQMEYAAVRGCSAAYVSKLKRQGRLVVTPGGKVNVEATDRLVDATRDPARGGDRRPGAATKSETHAGAASTGAGAKREDLSYKEAARRERLAKARIAELELAEAAGQLVRRQQVERVLFGLARQAQEALLSLSERLAGPLSVETDPFRCAQMIDVEARAIAQTMVEATIITTPASTPAPVEPTAEVS